MTPRDIQSFLDGAFHFYSFVYSSEQWIGMNMEKGFHDFFGELAPYLFSRIQPIRVHLDTLAHYWKDLPGFQSKSPLLLVEGHSEKAFFDELRKSHASVFLHLHVEVYAGKGNRRKKRIQMLLERYLQQGYVIYAQGDADSEHADVFLNLIEARLMAEENTFVFEHDFESSVPLRLMFVALKKLGVLEGIDRDEFIARISTFEGSFSARALACFGIDFDPLKMDLAISVADVLNHTFWWNNEDFVERTELGRFLRFVQRIN
jgi:hypothetical protein